MTQIFRECDYRDFGRTLAKKSFSLPRFSLCPAQVCPSSWGCPPLSLLLLPSPPSKLLLPGDQSLLPLEPCQLGVGVEWGQQRGPRQPTVGLQQP